MPGQSRNPAQPDNQPGSQAARGHNTASWGSKLHLGESLQHINTRSYLAIGWPLHTKERSQVRKNAGEFAHHRAPQMIRQRAQDSKEEIRQ